MRRIITFSCAAETLVGTLDTPPGGAELGLLIVSGGNEIRVGAHRGMAQLAARLAETGIAVFRFDRRGIGDSTGENLGFGGNAPDIAAAAAAFREAQPGLERLTALGNCDAATALALFHRQAGIDALILSNPWPGDEPDDLPAAPAIAAHYVEQLKQPRQWLRLFTGQVSLKKLFGGLTKLFRSKATDPAADKPVEVPPLEDMPTETVPASPRYAAAMADTLNASEVRATILLAERDNTAIAFLADWQALPEAAWPIQRLDSASHSYAGAGDKKWLFERVAEAVRAH